MILAPLLSEVKFAEYLLLLNRYLLQQENQKISLVLPTANPQILQILDYINAHLTEDLSVDRLCEHLHLSRRKLYEYSEEFLHCSIAKYIKKMRLQHAQTLLSETNLPISTISEQCGFSDYNYFCRIFKQETVCPHEAIA